MEELVKSVDRLLHAETGTFVVRLELSNMKFELQLLERDEPVFREALHDAQEEYENELDVLYNLLQLFAPTRYRRGVIDVDRRLGRQLDDVIKARREKEGAFNRWYRGHRRAESLRHLIRLSEAELENVMAVEQVTREDCYIPIIELARVWTTSRPEQSNRT
ncbi:hypothetical protein KC19_12G034300 [Ceratodon purpureus]|uniref:Uncharacterized protein n=1 Tax=Ceratodon purpureus TaxID=3225 RepID=A0A8T0G343_CERPU|nr:hypothetical protein KC19_12G034300 [Ceratodon purpureus]